MKMMVMMAMFGGAGEACAGGAGDDDGGGGDGGDGGSGDGGSGAGSDGSDAIDGDDDGGGDGDGANNNENDNHRNSCHTWVFPNMSQQSPEVLKIFHSSCSTCFSNTDLQWKPSFILCI